MEIFIVRDGQQTGPFNESTVMSLLKEGGLRSKDLGWHKGLAGWVPVGAIVNPGSAEAAPARQARPEKAVRSTPAKLAGPKQKAFLAYLGATMETDISREEAAIAISDALENPKLQGRIAKWHEEKLRLHPEVFQDELDHRRANRVGRFLELCHTEAADSVKDITKAHVQVLVEALDKKQSNWESDGRSALWDHLLPSVAEHFPQLVTAEGKVRLKYGGNSKVADSMANTAGVLCQPSQTPGPLHAAFRGIIYGVGVLVILFGALNLFKKPKAAEPATPNVAAEPAAASEQPKAEPAPAPDLPPPPQQAPLIGALDPNAGFSPAPAPVPAAPPVAEPAVGLPDPPPPPAPAPAGLPPAVAPVFSPPPVPGVPAVTPEAPAAPPAVATAPAAAPGFPGVPAAPGISKNAATLRQALDVTLPNGRVTLPAGTKLRILGYDGQNIRVSWNNNIFNVAIAATDASDALALAAPPPAALPPPIVPAVPKKPEAPSPDL